jgi:fumarate reductase subunit D
MIPVAVSKLHYWIDFIMACLLLLVLGFMIAFGRHSHHIQTDSLLNTSDILIAALIMGGILMVVINMYKLLDDWQGINNTYSLQGTSWKKTALLICCGITTILTGMYFF